jgi:hypothetical protein
MQVEIPFAGAHWPRTCPCCGRHADSTLQLQRSSGVFLVVAAAETVLRLEVPYCSTCTRHARAFQAGTFGGMLYPTAIVLAAAFFAGIMGLAITGGGSRSFEIWMMLGLPAVITILFVAVRLFLRHRAGVDAPHASTAPVIRIASWTNNSIRLDCDNSSYALALREANGRAGRT